MPHFDANGNEEWVCQKGGHICTGDSTWVKGLGNVCPTCMGKEPGNGLLSLEEHCRIESGGLTGPALDRYINRYYGHG